jgi:hypothetical protein
LVAFFFSFAQVLEIETVLGLGEGMKSTGGTCLSENVLFEWAAGSLAPDRLIAVEEHLDSCHVCREVLRNMTSADPTHPERRLVGEPVTPLARGTQVGRYLVVDVMGRGGTGIVYAAYDPELDRKVALKLLLADRGPADGSDAIETLRERLRREAQAMARLSHPNVVTVFDVGLANGQLFVAMELIEGATLAAWLGAEQRSAGEIVRQFVAAGRGLAAAHAAGFVHRDFKPANVLVGDDGRVCVTDFGLARLVDESGPLVVAGSPVSVGASLSGTLTQTGALVGTPVYMAPEQLRGEPADARSDQFNFCVALHEALYGERPFAGDTVEELERATACGNVCEPVRGRRIPPGLRRVLLRGLRADPAERYPSMGALLRELDRDPAARRRGAVLGLAALLLALGSVAVTRAAQEQRLVCRGGADRLRGVWDAPTKAEIHGAFSRTGKSYAEDVWHTVEHSLDAFASAWIHTYTEACEATRLRGEQSSELLDLRMDCLHRQLDAAAALTSLFAHADAELIDRAAEATQASLDVSRCGDVRTLRERRGPPGEATARAEYESLQREIDRMSAQENAGRFVDRQTRDGVVARAERLGHPLLLSDALRLQGQGRRRAGELDAARSSFHRAAVAAARGGDDGRAATALDLVALITVELGQLDDADRLLDYAAATSERAGKDAPREAQHLEVIAAAADERYAYVEEAAHYGEAAALYQRAGHVIAEAQALSHQGWSLSKAGQLDEAERVCSAARRLIESTLGRDHPFVLGSLNCLANSAAERNHADEALASLRRALAITEATYDHQGPRTVTAYNNMGEALVDSGDYAGALEAFAEAQRAAAGAQIDPRALVCIQLGTGSALLGLNRAGEALPRLEAAHEWLAKSGRDKDALARAAFALARALVAGGQNRERALRLGNEAAAAAAVRPPSPYTRALRDKIDDWLHRR